MSRGQIHMCTVQVYAHCLFNSLSVSGLSQYAQTQLNWHLGCPPCFFFLLFFFSLVDTNLDNSWTDPSILSQLHMCLRHISIQFLSPLPKKRKLWLTDCFIEASTRKESMVTGMI